MGLKLESKAGDTQLSPEDLDLLIPSHISTRHQLDEAEQNNIEDAIEWMLGLKNVDATRFFSIEFQDLLHKKMLGNVWKWAGQQRTNETNIGVPPHQISIERKKLNEDAMIWLRNENWNPIETALRFHHRLVQIHCYPNGNGRHSRIAADILLEKIYKREPLVWTCTDLLNENIGRRTYINALKAADKNDYSLLVKCVRDE